MAAIFFISSRPPQTQMSGWTMSRACAARIVAELVLGVVALAAGQRNVDVVGQLGHGVDVFRPDRLFQPHRVVRLDGLGQADGPRDLEELGVDIDADIDVGPEGLAHGGHALAGDAASPGCRAARCRRACAATSSPPCSRISGPRAWRRRPRSWARRRRRFDRRGSCRGTCRPAADRRAGRPPCRNVPERVLDAADGRVDHEAAGKAREVDTSWPRGARCCAGPGPPASA